MCTATYDASHAEQRTCGRICGVRLRRGLGPPPRLTTPPAPAASRPTRTRRTGIAGPIRGVVLHRDRYRCHLCTHRVRLDAPPGHPWSPALDHLVPYSKGGTDDPDNLRTAHAYCNGKRGAGPLPGMPYGPPPEAWPRRLRWAATYAPVLARARKTINGDPHATTP